MPSPADGDVSHTVRMTVREHILAWISRDVGLREFLIPELLTESWTQEQRQAWTNHILDKYLHANSVIGKAARRRVLTCETAGSLRRHCIRFRHRTVTYRDIMKTSVSLESLWNDVSPELDDSTWAKCSRLFDVSLASLRVSYAWMFMKAEASAPEVSQDVRREVFCDLVGTYFVADAPTDDSQDKHTANFKNLLTAWRQDLQKMTTSDKFDYELRRLEESNGLRETAANIERFLEGVDVDSSWVLRMRLMEKEVEKGNVLSKGARTPNQLTPRGRMPRLLRSAGVAKPAGRVRGRTPKRKAAAIKSEIREEAGSPRESESSFEPAQKDSDFEIDNAQAVQGDDDADSGDRDKDEVQEIPRRVSPRHRAATGTVGARLRSAKKRSLPSYESTMRSGGGLIKQRGVVISRQAGGHVTDPSRRLSGVGKVTAREPDTTPGDIPASSMADVEGSPQETPIGDGDLASKRPKPSDKDSPSGVVGDQDDLFDIDADGSGVQQEGIMYESRESRRRRLAAALVADESQSQALAD